MASTPIHSAPADATPDASISTGLLVHLSTVSPDALEQTLANLAAAFPGQSVSIALPESSNLESIPPAQNLRLLPYTPTAAPSPISWVLTAADYLNTYKLAQEHNASACLLLGADSHTMSPESIRTLADTVLSSPTDLAVSHYHPGAREGLLNSALLYPLTRALFCAKPRFPLAIDLGLSVRMAERLAAAAQRFTATNQNDAMLWSVSEAAVAGFSISEADVPARSFPQPLAPDLNTLLTQILGSFFADIDTRAAFWQRMRTTIPRREIPSTTSPAEPIDITPMLQSFHLAYSNLHEIWALVLPPHTLLGLKHLSLIPQESFRMPDNLWVRIVYDFVLAYRLRTINRGHLLGALIPLYLAWVASHLLLIQNGASPERHIEEVAQAFETDKPYFVSRWRWPDRFNP
ncbi:hypothetical protein [Edaphobacter albus]|uniref:hypothetical protein n=1 Tax=Edaphobacter sp. 4G125 TaxID=2763071 RepID=UPI0016480AD5|nr:hypothetical protein [Edaphobacter sp. 4G125]QNI37617.1 hypothetical protein H7846_04810 [Edaphobacter sp. 4G125]